MTDAELLESWRATRDRAVLDGLFARHYPTVYHVVLKLVRNATDASDLTQSVFLKAVESAETVRSTGSLRNWLLTIAVNEVRQFRRSAVRRSRLEHLQDLSRKGEPARGQEGEFQRREFEEHLEQVLQQIPDELKDPLVLHYYQNLSYSEMAEVLAIPRSTVQSRMDQALQTLREQFKKRGALSMLAEFLPMKRPTDPLLLGLTLMKTKTLAAALVILCCLLPFGAFVWRTVRPSPALSAGKPTTGAPPAEETRASGSAEPASDGPAIFGRVLEKATGAPIAGALVSVYNVEENTTDQALTDEKGLFRLASTRGSRASHQIQITRKGYASHSEAGVAASREPRTYPLSGGGTIAGRVEDAYGVPLFPYRLHIIRDRMNGDYDQVRSLYQLALPQQWVLEEGETTVHADGRFEIRHVAAGAMMLLVRIEGAHPFYGPPRYSVSGDEWPLKVHEGKTTEITIARPNLATLGVRAIDSETREPIPGARMVAVAEAGRHAFELDLKPGVTDENGLCTMPAYLGRYGGLDSMAFIISKPGYSSYRLSIGGYKDGHVFEAPLGKPARIRGRVQAPDGTPVERAAVYVEGYANGGVAARDFTDARGEYVVEPLNAPYEYTVHVFDRALKNAGGVVQILLREGETREINFGVPGQSAIAGTVTWKGAPVRAALVWIDAEKGRGSRVVVYTNDLGEYRIEGIEPGIYEVGANLEDAPGSGRQMRPVTVRAHECARADFRGGTYRIRGTVRDAATLQPPDKGEFVEVLARRIDGGDPKEVSEGQAREGGAFEIQVREAGVYQLTLGGSYEYFSPASIQVDLTSRTGVDDVRFPLHRETHDGTIVIRLVDAETGKPIEEGSYKYNVRSMRGMGYFEGGAIQEPRAENGRYSYRVSSGRHVEAPVSFEITPDQRRAEVTVPLRRSEAVRIDAVLPSSAGERAGLQPGDVVLAYDGAPIRNSDALEASVEGRIHSQKVPLQIRRDGETRVLMVPGGLLGIEVENTLLLK